MRIKKSERGVFEPAMSEEDVLGQILTTLELVGAVVTRHVEPVPHCARCDHLIGKHERRYAGCHSKGCWCTKYLWSKHTPKGGIPDLSGYFTKHFVEGMNGEGFGFRVPVHFYIEVKRPGGRRREKQTEFINQALQAGCCAMFAESVDTMVEEFKKFGVYLKLRL